MAQILSCPDDHHLKEIALGHLSDLDGDSLLQHIEGCLTCAERLTTLFAEDTLVEAVRSTVNGDRSQEQDVVYRIVEKIRALVPAAMNRDEQTLDDAASTPSPAMGADTNALPWVDSTAAPEKEPDGLAPPQAPDEIGRLGNYRVLRMLGEGGMGKVYLADDPDLQRSVALKIMKPSLARDLDARKRFLQEARLAAAIEHDHIVHIYQVGEDHGIPFFAMQLLKGESLEDLLRRSPALKIKDVLHIGLQIAEGLAAAHERGLIHRDIKPGNIWIEAIGAGRVKILDFGLARSSERDISITQLGAVLGTPAYMPPEQARGDKVDHRCDLYSLGCVLYRMATGELPLKGSHTMGMLTALAVDEPIAPIKLNPEIPQVLSDLIMKLLAKDPNQRVGSAKEVAQMLAMIERGDCVPPATVTACRLAAPSSEQPSHGSDPYATIAASKPVVTTRPMINGRRLAMVLATIAMLALLASIGVVFGASIIRIVTNKGVLVVEADDKSIEVKINGEQITIVDARSKREFTLSAGEDQELEVRELPDGVEFATKKFRLTRNGREIVNARIEIARLLPDLPPTNDPDRRAAEWVLSIDEPIKFIDGKEAIYRKREADQRFGPEPITIRVNGAERGITSMADLPRGAFELTQVNLIRNPKVTNASLAYLKDCKQIWYLDLRDTNVTSAGMAYFKDHKNLTQLWLGRTRVGDSGLANFKLCESLEYVDLTKTKVTDAGLVTFKHSKSLKALHLGGTQIGDESLLYLGGCSNLATLNLNNTRVSDKGLLHLKSCKNLTELLIRQTGVTAAGVADFRKTLPKCQVKWEE